MIGIVDVHPHLASKLGVARHRGMNHPLLSKMCQKVWVEGRKAVS